MPSRWVGLVLLFAPAPLVWGWSVTLAQQAAEQVGQALRRAVDLGIVDSDSHPLAPGESASPVSGALGVALTPPRSAPRVSAPASNAARDVVSPDARLAGAPRRAPGANAARAVAISSESVLRLVDSGARPRGRFIPASDRHPAGLRLSGASGLGLPIADGDILTHVAGAPARSEAQVVSWVIAARGRGLRTIEGSVWQGGQVLRVVVEQPYARTEPAAALAKASPGLLAPPVTPPRDQPTGTLAF